MFQKLLVAIIVTMLTCTAVGCVDTIQLQKSKTFTASAVRLYSWEDRCKLQSWFDSRPPANDVVIEAGGTGIGPDGKRRELGSTTHRIRHQRQMQMLRRLLRRYYRAVPALALRDSFTVTVDYYRYCGKTRQVRGSEIRIDAGGRTVLLAYHPCVGEFLLNGDLYATRRQHVETQLASSRRK